MGAVVKIGDLELHLEEHCVVGTDLGEEDPQVACHEHAITTK